MKEAIRKFFESRTIRIAVLLTALAGVVAYSDSHVRHDLEMMRRIVSLEEGLLKQLRYITQLEIQSSQLSAKLVNHPKYPKMKKDTSNLGMEIIASAVHPRILWNLEKFSPKLTPKGCAIVQNKLSEVQKIITLNFKGKTFDKKQRDYLSKVIIFEKNYFLKLCSR